MPPPRIETSKAPRVGAFFVALVWQNCIVAGPCSPPPETEDVKIRYVFDGDTLALRDNSRLRLIGVNTPEMGHDGARADALAVEARNRLRQLLTQHGNRARLSHGLEQDDPHGRALGHLWLDDGTNVTAQLLREGLGWAVAFPPNLRFLDCYLASEQTARTQNRGVWSHPDLAAHPSATLNLRTRGFLRVTGRVTRVNHGGGATWIGLQGRFSARIPDADLNRFESPPGSSWIGKNVEVRGWVRSVKGELRVTIRHPSALALQSVDGR
jgi:micrococcal nuclease